jgi:hypothetical protein
MMIVAPAVSSSLRTVQPPDLDSNGLASDPIMARRTFDGWLAGQKKTPSDDTLGPKRDSNDGGKTQCFDRRKTEWMDIPSMFSKTIKMRTKNNRKSRMPTGTTTTTEATTHPFPW